MPASYQVTCYFYTYDNYTLVPIIPRRYTTLIEGTNGNSCGTLLVPPAAADEEKGRKRGHLALRQGDAVPLHPLLSSYLRLLFPNERNEEKGRKRGHLALRQGDAVPLHPLLSSYLRFLFSNERNNAYVKSLVDYGKFTWLRTQSR